MNAGEHEAQEDGLRALVGALRAPRGVSLGVRVVDEDLRHLAVVRGVTQPSRTACDRGAMVTARVAGGVGYCASAALTGEALAAAARRATAWARACARSGLFEGVEFAAPDPGWSQRATRVARALPDSATLLGLLRTEADAIGRHERIVHWSASLRLTRTRQRTFVDGEQRSDQRFEFVEPNLEATASGEGRSQTRSLGGQYNGFCQQGGFEVIERAGLVGGGARVAQEALELLAAPNCPSGRMSLLLMPDQMMLQIHESIGHPLELDRILGDERNFAGTSFVRPEMFGTYRYGSELLDVSFDPGPDPELASYAVDDEGSRARKVMLIERGVLKRALGGALSQSRARALGFDIEGTANARANGWHRPPIDRMANLNVEPGSSSLEEMVAAVERGIVVKTNLSWSIDDARNKFQFGCEWGQLIENGRLGPVVRNPNYRGVSATFWRSLVRVGDARTFELMGTPFCGKGEPGQVIRVGHAAPACLFDGVDVFGAAD
ncbi:MAG TPA: TldD/PmbA family protein [Burkholderiaceae bacterium]